MDKTMTICFTNNKGGSGKSTTCSNVGAAMAMAGKKVLLVDGDMQLNLSLSFFSEDEVLKMAAGEKNLYYAIGKQQDLTDFIVPTVYPNLDLIPSSTLMSSIEYELFTKWQREFILRKCLQKIKDSGVYDYILIDCAPSLGMMTINALAATDGIVVPTIPQHLPTKGIEKLLESVHQVKRGINPSLKIEGILMTLMDGRTVYEREISEMIRNAYGGKINIFGTEIPRSVRAAETSAEGKSIFAYAPRSKVAEAYRQLTKEVLALEKQREEHRAEIGR